MILTGMAQAFVCSSVICCRPSPEMLGLKSQDCSNKPLTLDQGMALSLKWKSMILGCFYKTGKIAELKVTQEI